MKNGSVVIDDTEMYYASFGKGKKVLAVIPGLSDGMATVKGKALFLAAPYRRFMKDYTVYIFSRKNKMSEGYSIEDMAADQIRALKDLGIEKAAVLGVSQGGMIAQCMAAGYPHMAEKLILAVTAPYANEVTKNVVSSWIDMVKKGEYARLMTDTAEKTYSKGYLQKNRAMLKLSARLIKPADKERFLINAKAILRYDGRDKLKNITCPTLILAGDEDNTVGTAAHHELKKLIPHSELHIYEGLGHGVYDEAKDFYDRVYEFCKK